MRKLKIAVAFICFTAIVAHAQRGGTKDGQLRTHSAPDRPAERTRILSAIGIAGGITYGRQNWDPEGPLAQERWLLGFNGAIIAEFFHHPHYRWRTELEYNQMGTKELLYIPPGQYTAIHTNYIQFNNYLKIVYKEYRIIPYILIGPRVEYLLSRSAGVYPDIIGQFHTFQVTFSVGAGAEIAWKSPIRPFLEAFYNHDILPSFHNVAAANVPVVTTINYNAWELRIGLKYFFDKNKKEVCPPVYNPAGN